MEPENLNCIYKEERKIKKEKPGSPTKTFPRRKRQFGSVAIAALTDQNIELLTDYP